MTVKHTCGFEKQIFCRDCGTELVQDYRGELLCPNPRCGRRPAILCPACGKLW